jgi:hypothetical protein
LDKVEAMEIVRSQIEQIVLTPKAEGGLDIHLCGDLARIMQLCEAGECKSERPGRGGPGEDYRWLRGLATPYAGRSNRITRPRESPTTASPSS